MGYSPGEAFSTHSAGHTAGRENEVHAFESEGGERPQLQPPTWPRWVTLGKTPSPLRLWLLASSGALSG